MTTLSATSKLGRSDWTDAAIHTLLSSGIDAVQITRLASQLQVSRGSFYWHFADRGELLTAILDEWRVRNGRAIKTVLRDVDSLSTAVLEFFSLWVDNTCFSPALDQCVRDWAQLDPAVFERVRKEDQRRIRHIDQCFQRFGYEAQEALVRARILYFAQVGYYAMHMQEPMQSRLALLEQYYLSFTGRKLSAKVATEFKQRFEGKS
jgi:AcrR family transcriptional regulator